MQDPAVVGQNQAQNRYFFILGREPHLAIAELISVFARHGITYEITAASNEVLIVLTAAAVSADFFNELGGMIKYGECLFEVPSLDQLDLNSLETMMSGEKAIFGFSVYALAQGAQNRLQMIKSQLDRLALNLKRALKESVTRVRYVASREPAMSSVAVLTNKMMREGGFEFVALAREREIIFGRTLGVQDFSEFRRRDFGRPIRDPKRGTLPPKLARILVNLAGAPKAGTILDPFCGDGTVLTEAIALGYANLIGSDIDPAAVKNTEQNTTWCIKEYQQNADVRLFAADARDLGAMQPPQSVDAIVAEGDLGSPLRERLSKEEAMRAIEAKSILYRETVTALAPLLKQGGRMVIALPHYPTAVGDFGISFAGINLEQLRLSPAAPWPKDLPRFLGRFGQFDSYIYGREDQKVEREIFVFQKM